MPKDILTKLAQEGWGARMEKGHFKAVESLISEIEINPNNTVLDVGCGNGWTLRFLSPKIKYGIGIDETPYFVEEAREKSKGYDNLEFRVEQWKDLERYDPNQFDLVLSVESVYWLKAQERVTSTVQENINRAFRVIKPDGIFGLTVKFYKENKDCGSWPLKFRESDIEMECHSIKEYLVMLKRAGFKRISQYRYIYSKDDASEDFQWRYGTLILIAQK